MTYKILKAFIIFFVVLFCKNGFAQEKLTNSIKIKISDVEIARYPIKDSTFKYAVNRLAENKLEFYSKEFENTRILPTFMHPFVSALHYGFAQHRPVVISPDMVWLMILQGFSKHVKYNYVPLQSSIVNFKGKKKIEIRRNKFIKGRLDNDWQSVVNEIINKFDIDLKPDLKLLLKNRFSTTTPKDLIAFQITIMDALSPYYDISVSTLCGIPYIILEGDPDDWKWICDNFKLFEKYNLGFWTKSLSPILEKILESSKGNIDTTFWKSIYKWDEESGGNKVTGWILRFFPYLGDGSEKYVNPYLNKDYSSPQPEYRFWGLEGSSFGSGISSCDFTWKYYQSVYNMLFCGGFIGISQNKTDMTLRPEINWFVSKKVKHKVKDYMDLNPPKIDNTDYSKWIFADKSYPRYETEEIEACKIELDTMFYEICTDPDEMPIFRPEKNKSFEEGWADFSEYLNNKPHSYGEKGKVKFSFLITSSGDCYAYKPITDPNEMFVYAEWFIKDGPKWKPGKKNGKIVLTELITEIDFK